MNFDFRKKLEGSELNRIDRGLYQLFLQFTGYCHQCYLHRMTCFCSLLWNCFLSDLLVLHCFLYFHICLGSLCCLVSGCARRLVVYFRCYIRSPSCNFRMTQMWLVDRHRNIYVWHLYVFSHDESHNLVHPCNGRRRRMLCSFWWTFSSDDSSVRLWSGQSCKSLRVCSNRVSCSAYRLLSCTC